DCLDYLDCRATLSMNTPVVANAVTQSMTPEVMDCRATLAMTKSLFKVRVRYRAGYGWLAVTSLSLRTQ
ncbi:hypothetical protein, partial [Rhodoferax sp.]|uniref:hypothetical protein n=1 Tax=Rhodoferax sp. TaxID=50421 RepID=UPI0025EE85FA